MFKIQSSSFSDCFECKLYDSYSCILDTNCKYMDDAEIVIIAENPGKNEVENNPPKPLIGKAGQLFRKYFESTGLVNHKYIITNVVLCQTINQDGTTGNPDQETIDRCKGNCFALIERAKPKLILLMGTSPAKAFELLPKGVGIKQMRGEVLKWNDFNVLLTIHPSYLARGNKDDEPKFRDDLVKAESILSGRTYKHKQEGFVIVDKSEPFYYKIPDIFYTSEYRLIDIQFLNKTNEVLYIFRDKNNKKIYHKENDTYICYHCPDENKNMPTVPYSELKQIRTTYRQKNMLNSNTTYEGDVKIHTKHAQDYYLIKKEEEVETEPNTMFIDIETYTDTMENSTVENANDPIAMIGYIYNNKHTTYILNPKSLSKKEIAEITPGEGLVVFDDEKDLINKFISDIKVLGPDIMTGWYFNPSEDGDGFDLPYIINRSRKLGIDINTLSPFNEVDYDQRFRRLNIAGIVVTDMLSLYKSFTFGKKESYSLDYIANLELGEGKLGKGYRFSEMFRNSPDEAIKYNMQDVIILKKLDAKLKHVRFQNEIRKVCRTSYDDVKSSMSRLDSLIVSFLKSCGISSRNANIGEKGEKYEGAYVKAPIVGLHEYIVDFDFTSLYPSLILTYNIGVNTFVAKFEDYKLGYYLSYDRDKLPEKFNVFIDPTFTNKKVEYNKDDFLKFIDDEKLIYTINGCFFKSHDDSLSYYNRIINPLLKARKDNKKLMFEAKTAGDSDKEQLYDMKQNVQKVITNSIYGCIGNNAFRFYNVDCARSITLSGQEALKTSIIESNSYVNSIKDVNSYKVPDKLSIDEMFGDLNRKIETIITGDTDSIFVTYNNIIDKNNDEDEILKSVYNWNDSVQKFLNNDVIHKILSIHNINPTHNKLELKNELVIKRGLFLAKKRYVVHVISNENKKVDKIKPMGIETRRSDFPSLTKEKINELLDIILKNKKMSISEILNFVKVTESLFKNEIKNGSKKIARPVSFTKKLDEYKVIPQGVKGMINFNILEYNVFGPGSRGYLFKLQGIDPSIAPKNIMENYEKNILSTGSKINEIVIPEEMINLPEYYIVDLKSILKFSWIDRYKLLLDPILKVDENILTF